MPNHTILEANLESQQKQYSYRKAKGRSYNKHETNTCNYIGRLNIDKDSVVASSGCPPINKKNKRYDGPRNITQNKPKMKLTILSSATNITKVNVDEFGNIIAVKPDGLTDILLEDVERPSSEKSQYIFENVRSYNFPTELNLHLAFGYDKSVREFFEDLYSASDAIERVEQWIDDILTHMQAYFWLSTLKMKINLKV